MTKNREHVMSKNCWCKPRVISFKGDPIASKIMAKLISFRELEHVNTEILENMAQELKKELKLK